MKDERSVRRAIFWVMGMVMLLIHAVEGEEITDIEGLPGWTWSGEDGSLAQVGKGWRLSGGSTGGVLRYRQPATKHNEWLFLEGTRRSAGESAGVKLLEWNGCEVLLYEIEGKWVPMVGDLPIRTEYAADQRDLFKMGVRMRGTGQVDFAWAAHLMIEGAPLGRRAEENLEIVVAAGSVLEIEQLRWEKEIPHRMKAKRKQPKSNISPPADRPPPHPYIGMDEERRVLAYPGGPAAEGAGSLHASGNLKTDQQNHDFRGVQK